MNKLPYERPDSSAIGIISSANILSESFDEDNGTEIFDLDDWIEL